jgi:hypothetical protein
MFRDVMNPSLGPADKTSMFCTPRHMASRAHLEISPDIRGWDGASGDGKRTGVCVTKDDPKTLEDVVLDTARRKRDAAAFRKSGKPKGVEESRDVYRNACKAIAGHFAPLGFNYRKTHPRFFRKDDLFEYRVTFQTSRNNVPGRHVMLWMHASVHSKKLELWRKSQVVPNPRADYVAGGMVHLLTNKPMIQWELADPTTRDSVIADVVAFTRNVVLPFFDQFRDVQSLLADLPQRPYSHAFPLRDSVEFALSFGDRESAQRFLDRFLKERPDQLEAIAKVKQVGFKHPNFGPGNYAEQVVFMRRSYGLL